MKHDYILIHEESLDFIITFAVSLAVAFNQLDVYKSCLRRVPVTIYAHFILVDAYEIIMFLLKLCCILWLNWVETVVVTLIQA